ncbi:MAG: hypothetical protein AAF213_09915, partial [Pseudomonadota bacterium]
MSQPPAHTRQSSDYDFAPDKPQVPLDPVFEYQVWSGSHWRTEQIFSDEAGAISQAQADIMGERFEKVQVLKTWPEPQTDLSSRIVYQREITIENRGKPARLGRPPSAPPMCHDPHDFFEPQ